MFGIKTKIKNFIRREISSAVVDTQRHSNLELINAQNILSCLYGFNNTLRTKLPVAADGSPLPWYTYPAIEYFKALDARGLNIFEYGCGQSSLFWSDKGANLWCVEHDKDWHKSMMAKNAAIKEIMLCEDKNNYIHSISETNQKFDIISIDGTWRNECAQEALKHLRPEGFIIFDNSDWYTDTVQFLRDNGFFQIDFNGFGPCNDYCWCTSLLLPFKSPFMDRQAQPVPVGGIKSCKSDKY